MPHALFPGAEVEGRYIFLSGDFSDRDFSGWENSEEESIPVGNFLKEGTFLGGNICECGGRGVRGRELFQGRIREGVFPGGCFDRDFMQKRVRKTQGTKSPFLFLNKTTVCQRFIRKFIFAWAWIIVTKI